MVRWGHVYDVFCCLGGGGGFIRGHVYEDVVHCCCTVRQFMHLYQVICTWSGGGHLYEVRLCFRGLGGGELIRACLRGGLSHRALSADSLEVVGVLGLLDVETQFLSRSLAPSEGSPAGSSRLRPHPGGTEAKDCRGAAWGATEPSTCLTASTSRRAPCKAPPRRRSCRSRDSASRQSLVISASEC